jgi:hypothetical protein
MGWTKYAERIDCADLAISALIEFASKNKLPVKLKYFQEALLLKTLLPAQKKLNHNMRLLSGSLCSPQSSGVELPADFEFV